MELLASFNASELCEALATNVIPIEQFCLLHGKIDKETVKALS